MKIQIDEGIFLDEKRFHSKFSLIMGFPIGYGANWDAWIDCMSYLNDPQEQMTKFNITQNESLEIEIVISDGNSYYKTSTWASFCSCCSCKW